MNDQLRHRELIVYLQQMFEFILIFHPKPCFQGKTDIDPTIYFFQELFQGIRFCQKTCPPVLCHHRPGRAAQIQIDLPISEPGKLRCRTQKILCISGQDLRNRIHSLIVFRINVFLFSAAEIQILFCPDKRNEIFIKTSETFIKSFTINITGDSFQRCKV